MSRRIRRPPKGGAAIPQSDPVRRASPARWLAAGVTLVAAIAAVSLPDARAARADSLPAQLERPPRASLSAQPPAGNATNPSSRRGRARTTSSRCRKRTRPRCSATSTMQSSSTPASNPRSSSATANSWSAPTGPTASSPTYEIKYTFGVYAAAAIPDRISRRALPGARHRMGRAAARRGRAALVPPLSRARRSTTRIRCTGPAFTRTGTCSAPRATRPT